MDNAKFTFDWELDWGGRVNETTGIKIATPIILKILRESHIQGLFFISTEILEMEKESVDKIKEEGHEIGSHGHFHTIYKEEFRKEEDRQISLKLLALYQSIPKESVRYRAPKFNYEVAGEQYSYRKSHVSLLRHMWFGEEIKEDTIIYIHPFDIVGGNNPPNLFCKLWYSQPKRALKTLENLVHVYS